MMKKQIFSFFDENKLKILTIFILYAIPLVSIGMANYPYIDDIGRRVEGVGNFAAHYSRYLSEYTSYIVQGSRHLTDMGLTTFLLSATILTISSAIVLFILLDQRINWLSVFASVVIGLNPWFLEPLSFRFDGPYICLSVLVSVAPFLYFRSKSRYYFGATFIGIFLMFNSYQGSSGIYPILLLTLLYKGLVQKTSYFILFKQTVIAFFAYVVATGVYFIETKFNPDLSLRGDTTTIASLKELPHAVINNLRVYFETLRSQSNYLWLCLMLSLFILFLIYMMYSSQMPKMLALGLGIVYIALGSILSFGLYMFFASPLADDRPRYEYGFAFFVAILLILLGEQIGNKLMDFVKGSLILLIVYYTVSFSFVYASMLNVQKDSFEDRAILLAGDLKNYVKKEQQTVYISSLFKDSPIYLNAVSTYPILQDLIPSNSSLYWPNLLWFNSLTQLDINLIGFDFNMIEKENLDLLESNNFWDIYQLDEELYVYIK